ncbi:hypothetical protein Prum_026730 [Phytohabitans rumicis]|uniref:DivIVA domain-containing protein n=2 Tax=Phytohabitans rumicis TaxID=1076125 RepID=A0A6V8L2N9_9ACTN|nr:hypothetical protein Prum_026730 [Phytohabitans rumicis]
MTERIGPPLRDDRSMPPAGPPMPQRPMPAQAGPPRDPYGRYDDQGGYGNGYDSPPTRGGYDAQSTGSFGAPAGGYGAPPDRFGGQQDDRFGGPPRDDRDRFGGPPRDDRDRFGGPPDDRYGGAEERFDGFAEPGRHGKADMTAEIRMGGGGPMGGPPMGGPPPGMSGLPPELQRIDQMRRTFQVRRFGSGYDPVQVDRLFEGILAGMTGRGPMPMNPNELEGAQFGLVPGGYFEAEVDAALKEVTDLLRRQ